MARYGKKSQQEVKEAMHEMKRGKLKSGRSGKTVRNPKQAIAIGLSEARKKGAKVPPPKGKSSAGRRSASKGTAKSSSRSKAASSRTTRRSTLRTAKKSASSRTTRKASSPARSQKSQTGNFTIDHEFIRNWVEERNGKPSRVKGTGAAEDPGILRIDFPGYSGEESLEEIPWEEFFEKFDANGLAFLYQERTSGGQLSRFNKFVRRK